MIRKLSLTAAAVVLAASPVLAADTYVIDKSHSEAGFQVRHLMGKVRGHFNDYAGTLTVDPAKPESASVEFTIKAATIDTANETRDYRSIVGIVKTNRVSSEEEVTVILPPCA